MMHQGKGAADPFHGFQLLVTGATSGIGRDLVHRLAKRGAVITGFGATELKVEALRERLGPGHSAGTWDLSLPIDRLPDLIKPGQQFDGVLFSAGVSDTRPILSLESGYLENVFRINLLSVIESVRLLIQGNHLSSSASLVFISSIAADHPGGAQGIYSITKAGLISFMGTLVSEFRRKPWRFNAVTPGMVKTELLDRTRERLGREWESQLAKGYPRGFAEVGDVTGVIELLLDGARSGYLNGAEIHVDGGARHIRF